MNALDVAVVALIVVFALRGFWRGFLRELFALAGLIAGIAGAIMFSDGLAAMLSARVKLPGAACGALAFLGIFLVLHMAFNLVGIVLDRVTRSAFVGGLNRAGGALFAIGKTGVVIAFVLLFLHLFPIVPKFDDQIASSSIARPLVAVAGTIIRAGLRVANGPGGSSQA